MDGSESGTRIQGRQPSNPRSANLRSTSGSVGGRRAPDAEVDVPGVSYKDFDITLNNNVLTVRGQRQFGNGYKQENLAWTERPYGTFIRTFTLPNTIDLNSIDATYVNGVLQIVFAKCEDAKPKQIPVKAAQKELAAYPSA